MSKTIGRNTSQKDKVRAKRRKKIRSRVTGTLERPRMSVFRSNSHLYVQVIDDVNGSTVVSASTNEGEFRGKLRNNITGAKSLGEMIAKRAVAKDVKNVVFDRNGYLYHGRIKAFAEGAREGGLKL